MASQAFSVFGWVSLAFNILFFVLPSALRNIVTATIRAWLQQLPIGASIWNGFARSLMTNISPHQIQALLPSTINTYRSWMTSAGKTPLVQVLSDGSTRLLWQKTGGTKVLLFFHGGGYVMPLSPGHLDWMAYITDKASDAGIRLDICLLEYDLVPHSPYPRQMTQAILALKYLLNSGYSPSDIIIGGDSAGGHLALSLLSHLHKPRPEQGKINLTAPIKGCFLVSPLTSFNLTNRSYDQRFSADVLSKTIVRKWGNYLINRTPWQQEIAERKGWGMALDVPEEWWKGLDIVDQIMVTAGYEEVFRDHVLQLVGVFRRRCRAKVEWLVPVDEAHDGPLMDFSAGRAPSVTTDKIAEWVILCFEYMVELQGLL